MHRTGTKRICLPRVQILVKCLPTIDVSFQLSIVGIGSSLTTIFRSSATIAESLLACLQHSVLCVLILLYINLVNLLKKTIDFPTWTCIKKITV